MLKYTLHRRPPPRACNRLGRVDAFYFNFLSNVTIALWNENIFFYYIFVKKRAAHGWSKVDMDQTVRSPAPELDLR